MIRLWHRRNRLLAELLLGIDKHLPSYVYLLIFPVRL